MGSYEAMWHSFLICRLVLARRVPENQSRVVARYMYALGSFTTFDFASGRHSGRPSFCKGHGSSGYAVMELDFPDSSKGRTNALTDTEPCLAKKSLTNCFAAVEVVLGASSS